MVAVLGHGKVYIDPVFRGLDWILRFDESGVGEIGVHWRPGQSRPEATARRAIAKLNKLGIKYKLSHGRDIELDETCLPKYDGLSTIGVLRFDLVDHLPFMKYFDASFGAILDDVPAEELDNVVP